MDPKNQKFENPSTTHKFYVDLGPKRYLGQRDPIIGFFMCSLNVLLKTFM